MNHYFKPRFFSAATFSSQENFSEKIMNGSLRMARLSESARMNASRKALAKLPSIPAMIKMRAVSIIGSIDSIILTRNRVFLNPFEDRRYERGAQRVLVFLQDHRVVFSIGLIEEFSLPWFNGSRKVSQSLRKLFRCIPGNDIDLLELGPSNWGDRC